MLLFFTRWKPNNRKNKTPPKEEDDDRQKILIYCEHIFHKPEKECEITIGIVNCSEIKRKNPNG